MFYAKRRELYQNVQKLKEDLIKQAAELENSEEWQKTSEKFRHLMDEWKAVGSAGREYEDSLWEKFNNSRQKFYERRNEHYEELHEVQNGRYEQKQQLVAKAKEIADKLESIADDGIVDHMERADFDTALAFLRSLEETITDMLLWAMSRPAATETALVK